MLPSMARAKGFEIAALLRKSPPMLLAFFPLINLLA